MSRYTKLAVFELVKRGWQVAIFVHDEIIVSVPEGSDYEALGQELVAIMVNSMQRVVPNVKIAASPAVVMHHWSKDAVLMRDEAGDLVPWPQR